MAVDGLQTVLALEVALRGGRPKIPGEIRCLIRQMSLANRLWGAPHIHGEVLRSGSKSRSLLSPSAWRGVGEGARRPGRHFCTIMWAGIGAMDFLVVPTVASFRSSSGSDGGS
jgi:hypothetical protein